MAEIIELSARGRDGSLSDVELALELAPRPTLSVQMMGRSLGTFSSGSLFATLMDVRLALEANGYLLCCQGSRANVFASGMLQQFSDGRQAYVLTDELPPSEADVVDIFARAAPEEVSTVAEQRAFVFRYFGLEDRMAD